MRAASAQDYCHELDKKTLGALKAIPGFTAVLRKGMELFSETQAECLNMASKIRLGPNQLPNIYNLFMGGKNMGKTIVHGNFEWDSEKYELNIKKHGIRFEEILPMFDDPLFWERYDMEHSTAEETRYFGTAKINGFAVIVSSYTERGRTR